MESNEKKLQEAEATIKLLEDFIRVLMGPEKFEQFEAFLAEIIAQDNQEAKGAGQ